MEIPTLHEDIIDYRVGFLSVYSLGPAGPSLPPIDPVILDFYQSYQITLAQIHTLFWCVVYIIRHYSSMIEGMPFTLNYLIRMCRPRLLCGGLIKLRRRALRSLFACTEKFEDDGWLSRFVRVRMSNLIPVAGLPFPKKWNTVRK